MLIKASVLPTAVPLEVFASRSKPGLDLGAGPEPGALRWRCAPATTVCLVPLSGTYSSRSGPRSIPGTGTVALVAQANGREWLGIELNPDYCPWRPTVSDSMGERTPDE